MSDVAMITAGVGVVLAFYCLGLWAALASWPSETAGRHARRRGGKLHG